jgi:polygalacturonase
MNIDLNAADIASEDWRTATRGIQAAIDSVAAVHGGSVKLGGGNYLVGGIRLRTGVELNLDPNARLLAYHDHAAYPTKAWRRVIWADDAEDVALTGAGTIDCQSMFEQRSVPPIPAVLPYTTYVGGHYRNAGSPRPVFFHGCRNVRVSGVHLLNGGEWHCYLLHCDQALIEGITIRQTAHSTWTDGIDLESCRNVTIRGCDIQTGDDAICIKTGKRGRKQSSSNILVEDCKLVSETNGFKIGNEVSHDITNVTVRNCHIKAHPDREAAGPFGGIAIQSADGAEVSNIRVSDIDIEDARCPISIKLGRGGGYRSQGDRISALHDVVLERITARVTDAKEQEGIACTITGYQGHCAENITLKDIRIEVPGGQTPDPGPVPDPVDRYLETPVFGVLPAYGLYARYIRNLSLQDVQFTTKNPDTRPPIVLESVA